ncbi:AAA family ATPase [Sorangium sp. So ce136]|uniref:AAA family ATPase n=1 Tax=Sorangium sp. So ce136 TaxID=3133284 RepID=UPI003EFFBA61
MSKKNKQRNQRQQPQPARPAALPSASPATPQTVSPAASPVSTTRAEASTAQAVREAEYLHAEALAGLFDEERSKVLESTAPLAEPGAASGMEAVAIALQLAREARALFLDREASARRTEDAALQRSNVLDQLAAELVIRENQVLEAERVIDAQRADWRGKYAEVAAREAELARREEGISRREIEAAAGFAAQQRESLRQLEAEVVGLREEASRYRSQISADRAACEEELRESRSRLEAELSEARTRNTREMERERMEARGALAAEQKASEEEQTRIEEQRVGLEKRRRKLDWEKADLDEYRRDLDHRVEQRVGARETDLRDKIRDIEEQLAAARKERDRLTKMLAERDETDRRFGHRTPGEILDEIASLQRERAELRAALSSRPSAEAVERLAWLEGERERWELDRSKLMQELQVHQIHLARSRIAVTELETVRDQRTALECSRAALQSALEELRRDVDERVRSASAVTAFPACSGMDQDHELQARPPCEDRLSKLDAFVEDLRQRMALDPSTGKRLYYAADDIRSFLAGLAMSRLLLLQGISGTGKTSLPVAFARAVGGEVTVIPVQSGWRDRQDVIGHFNTFEKKYHESELLQALYKAQCPKCEDRICFVVLDEMNLSHPEQYFADFLSALEQDAARQELDLMPASMPSAPALLREGRKLKIPPNVWFVGTANHDETTKDFADKTYDRAHVMELPRQRQAFEPKASTPRLPVGLRALDASFEAAKEKHQAAAQRAHHFLDSELANTLEERFRVGWGNRLQRQLECFVPVMIAAGGTIGEAADHVLATKVLRKVRDRHDTNADDIFAVKRRIEQAWPTLDAARGPEQSLRVLRGELKRLGADPEVSS